MVNLLKAQVIHLKIINKNQIVYFQQLEKFSNCYPITFSTVLLVNEKYTKNQTKLIPNYFAIYL